MAGKGSRKSVKALTHDEAGRRHIPIAELTSMFLKRWYSANEKGKIS